MNEEVIPRCDLCGEPEDQDPTNGREYNWNGETGNHLSCERQVEYEKERQRDLKESARAAHLFLNMAPCEDCRLPWPQGYVHDGCRGRS